jgi:hypothetical protein
MKKRGPVHGLLFPLSSLPFRFFTHFPQNANRKMQKDKTSSMMRQETVSSEKTGSFFCECIAKCKKNAADNKLPPLEQ